jgi:hypothetical protein
MGVCAVHLNLFFMVCFLTFGISPTDQFAFIRTQLKTNKNRPKGAAINDTIQKHKFGCRKA